MRKRQDYADVDRAVHAAVAEGAKTLAQVRDNPAVQAAIRALVGAPYGVADNIVSLRLQDLRKQGMLRFDHKTWSIASKRRPL